MKQSATPLTSTPSPTPLTYPFTGNAIDGRHLEIQAPVGHFLSLDYANPNMIRKFRPLDMDQILRIWLDASIASHDFVPSEFWESRVSDMRNIYLPAAETYVFDEDGIIKGFVSLYGDTLAAIFVSPSEQGVGIGRQLMDKSKNVRRNLTLTVYKENYNSIEFYKKCGFRVQREQLDEHTGHPELVMVFNS